LVQRYPDYVCRVTADEAEIGRGHLSRFQDVESASPVILTTSQLLTTGVDAPTCQNVVLARVVGSMVEFKQIIGRGTRLREDYGKLSFNILDYTGSATRLFADPAFDGDPEVVIVETTDETGAVTSTRRVEEEQPPYEAGPDEDPPPTDPPPGGPRRKLYFDGGQVEIAAHLVYELDAGGKQLRVVQLVDYARERVLDLYPDADALHAAWIDPTRRAEMIGLLAQRGIDLATLSAAAQQPDADLFDLLCHIAFGAPLRTRRQRAERLRREHTDFFDRYGPEARAVLEELLDKYAQYGTAEVTLPEALKVPPISSHGNVGEIMRLFGGGAALKAAVEQLQTLLYAA
ncbi:MAG TPA: type I restriction-modification enzyme R subunit C-terminal domain-containing protein, partial [Chloroflexota bacterium]